MIIERTFDSEYITSIATHDKCWDACSDDGTVDKLLYFPPMDDAIIWLKAEDCGVFMLHPHNSICYEVHTMLPHAGKKAIDCAKAGMEWMFKNTACERIITNVPEYNRVALIFAKKAGMEVIGINKKSFKKNGVLHNQTLLGLSKELVCQH